MGKLTGKVALITGGTTGIGRATAVAYAREGAKVVVAGRREAEGAEAVRLIHEAGGEGLFVATDVSREADVKNLIAKTLEAYGRLDVAFNNAGVELFKPITESSEADYDHIMDINVKGVFLSMQNEIPALLQSGGGVIVNTSSIGGQIGMANVSVYAASKHAVNGLTRCAAMEYAKQNIRVNAVAPGGVRTEMLERFAGGEGSEMDKAMAAMHPVGRIGTPDEIADAVLWLSTDASSFVTGQVVAVDGGFTTA